MKCHRYGKESKQERKEETKPEIIAAVAQKRTEEKNKCPGQNKLPSCNGGQGDQWYMENYQARP